LRQLSKAFTSKWHVNEVIHYQIKETSLTEETRQLPGLSA